MPINEYTIAEFQAWNIYPSNDYCGLSQGQLQRWTEHSTLIFENLKPVEISKNILTSFEHL